MQLLSFMVDFILHINVYLGAIVNATGNLVYLVLFAIVFAETGLVVTPFLPGDSLLFAAGALAAATDPKTGQPILDIWLVLVVFMLAAFIGDNTNYAIGRFAGPRLMRNEDSKVFRRSYLDRTQVFFDRYGPRTVVIARFVPIVRTFAPFMAGFGHMRYPKFLGFSALGTVMWVSIFTAAGYFFGNIPAVQENFTLAILAVIAISLLPGVWHFVQHRIEAKRAAAEETAGRSE